MLLLMLACAAEWEAELTPLEVQAWAPTLEAPGLPESPLHLSFNAVLRQGTLDNLAVFDAQGAAVTVDVDAEAGRPTLWVWPAQGWTPGQGYTLELYPGLEGVNGELLGSELAVDFAILEAPEGDWE